jgi:hypothetical protein
MSDLPERACTFSGSCTWQSSSAHGVLTGTFALGPDAFILCAIDAPLTMHLPNQSNR